MRRASLNPYKGMKNLLSLFWLCQTAAALFCGAAIFAADSLADVPMSAAEQYVQATPVIPGLLDHFKWSLLWSGSWEESTAVISDDPVLSGTLHNRGEIKLQFLPLDLSLRAQALDRRKLNFALDPPWGNSENWVTNFQGGLYHKPTGSRLLYGVLDEWGLPARIRNPWIRSPPYAQNHKPVIADLKTSANSTKEDEIYLYVSSPPLNLFPDVKLRGFVSVQNEITYDKSQAFAPAVSAGMDFSLPKNFNLTAEAFYFGKTLEPLNADKWFSGTPPLPARQLNLYAGAILLSSPDFSVSSDFAVSETFAWGTDIYVNLGLSLTPVLPFGTRKRPLSILLAFDGSGERFVNRDGANLKEGFRGALKIEWRSRFSSLLKFDAILRSSGFGDDFNRSSINFYYRFPSSAKDTRLFRFTRISFSADRNSENTLKIDDSYSVFIGLNINPRQFGINSLFGVNFSGSLKGQTMSDDSHVIFPVPDELWNWRSASVDCEIIWTPYFKNRPGFLQFRSKIGCNFFAEKNEIWDFSVYSSARFKNGRLSLKASSPDFPEKWNWTVSWRLNIP